MSVFASGEELEAASVCGNRRWQAWHVRLHVSTNNLVACKHTFENMTHALRSLHTSHGIEAHWLYKPLITFIFLPVTQPGSWLWTQVCHSRWWDHPFMWKLQVFPCLSCCLFFHLFPPLAPLSSLTKPWLSRSLQQIHGILWLRERRGASGCMGTL